MRKWRISKKPKPSNKSVTQNSPAQTNKLIDSKLKGNYAFIDSQNLNVGTQKFGWKLDWAKFRKHLQTNYNVTHAYLFIGYVPEFEAMYEQLHDQGYLIVLKPTFDMTRLRPIESPDTHKQALEVADSNNKDLKDQDAQEREGKAEDKKVTKGNVDADLVLWTMKELPNYDRAVIVSGDGDFYSLVEYLDSQKRLLKLVAPNMHYSKLYNKYESYIDRLDAHKNQLSYRPVNQKQRRSSKNPLSNQTTKNISKTRKSS
jgi:uncharacterized LabA/DUF88 family protein